MDFGAVSECDGFVGRGKISYRALVSLLLGRQHVGHLEGKGRKGKEIERGREGEEKVREERKMKGEDKGRIGKGRAGKKSKGGRQLCEMIKQDSYFCSD